MGGLGIRSQVEISPTAFIGGLDQALPQFTVAGGVCQQLAGDTGDGQGQVDKKWQPIVQSGCRTCRELFQAWTLLHREATQRAEYLGQELGGALRRVQVKAL